MMLSDLLTQLIDLGDDRPIEVQDESGNAFAVDSMYLCGAGDRYVIVINPIDDESATARQDGQARLDVIRSQSQTPVRRPLKTVDVLGRVPKHKYDGEEWS